MITNSKSTKVENNILIKEKCANIDYLYGPYESKQAAFDVFSETENLAQGKTVGIIEDGKIVEYWWPTEDLTLNGLVQKIKTDDGEYLPITGGTIRKEGSLDAVTIDNRSVELYDGTQDSTMQLIPAGIVLDSDSGKYEITRDDLLKLKTDYIPLGGGRLIGNNQYLEVWEKTEISEYSTVYDTVRIDPTSIKISTTDIGTNDYLELTYDSIKFVPGRTFTARDFDKIWDHVNDDTIKEVKTSGIRIYSQDKQTEIGHLDSTAGEHEEATNDIELVNEDSDICIEAIKGSVHFEGDSVTTNSNFIHNAVLGRIDFMTPLIKIKDGATKEATTRLELTNKFEANYDYIQFKLASSQVFLASETETKLRYSGTGSISVSNTSAKIVARKLEWVKKTDGVEDVTYDIGNIILNALQDANSDNKTYGRKNGEWVEITSGGSGEGTVKSVNNIEPDDSGNVTITIPAAQVQADWNVVDTTSKSFIQNKPTIPKEVECSTDARTSGPITIIPPTDGPKFITFESFGGVVIISGTKTTHELVLDMTAPAEIGITIQSADHATVGTSSVEPGGRLIVAVYNGIIVCNVAH